MSILFKPISIMESNLTPETLPATIKQMTSRLINMVSQLTYNYYSPNYRYIFSEITNEPLSESARFALLQKQHLTPRPLADIIAAVLLQYDNFYDINLYIHQARRRSTVIDIRYYAKSSLPTDYRQLVQDQSPMLHTKVAIPYWVRENKQKFDINWKVYAPLSKAKRLWLTQKWRLLTRLKHAD